jgi:hypothetical protein
MNPARPPHPRLALELLERRRRFATNAPAGALGDVTLDGDRLRPEELRERESQNMLSRGVESVEPVEVIKRCPELARLDGHAAKAPRPKTKRLRVSMRRHRSRHQKPSATVASMSRGLDRTLTPGFRERGTLS